MTFYTGIWYFVPAKLTAGEANEFVAEHYSDADARTQNNALHLFGSCWLAQNFGREYAIWIATMHEAFLLPRNRNRQYRSGSDTWHDMRNNATGIESGSNGANCADVAFANAGG
jgi:hypothetical protein